MEGDLAHAFFVVLERLVGRVLQVEIEPEHLLVCSSGGRGVILRKIRERLEQKGRQPMP